MRWQRTECTVNLKIQSQYYDEKQKNSDNVEDADLEINEGVEALKVEMEGGQ